MRVKIISISIMMLISAFAGCMGDSPSEHMHGEDYKGVPLTTGSAGDFILEAHTGQNFTLSSLEGDLVVVSFIFTRCPDTCPLITSKLRHVFDELGDKIGDEVHFVSISLDPEYDTKERLTAYTELHQVDWPHLTGEREDLEQVWENFGLQVDRTFIESHVKMNHVSVLYPDNSTETFGVMNQDLPTEAKGWNLTTMSFESNNISLNSTYHEQYGHSVTGINGTDSPDDWSWWWSLLIWNSSNSSWDESDVGISFVEVGPDTHIAWAASSSNVSLLPNPEMLNDHSHHGHGDSDSEDNDSHSGHDHSDHGDDGDDSGDGNESHSGHNHSDHGDDDSEEDSHDHMHTHSLSEGGHDHDDEETVELTNYTVGHNTVTFILDEELDKRIAFLGDSWPDEHLVDDVNTLLKESSGDSHSHSSPSIGVVFTILSILGAVLFLQRSRIE